MAQYVLKDFPDTQDPISAVRFSPSNPTRLLVGSWDHNLYSFDTSGTEGGQLLQKYAFGSVILDCCWGATENDAFIACNDCAVRRVDLTSGDALVLSEHTGPAARLSYHAATSTLFSISWAGELHMHDLSADAPKTGQLAKLRLPAKPFAIDASPSKLVVCMANAIVYIYDISELRSKLQQSSQTPDSVIEAEPWQKRDASLKHMHLSVACLPNDSGYATSSIEGRAAVDWFDESPEVQAKKFAFKCHRETVATTDENGQPCDMDIVHPVHALAFNPNPKLVDAFVSGGQDRNVTLWNAANKRRVRAYKFDSSVKSLSWNCNGDVLAVATCPGLESDGTGNDTWTKGPSQVVIRQIPESDTVPKASKK